MKAVLTHKPSSIYDDLPEERYHFPATYLRQVEAAAGDFIVYYEPGRTEQSDRQRTGLRSYVATARLTDVRPDPRTPQHYYAIIDPSTYLYRFTKAPSTMNERFGRTMARPTWVPSVGRSVRSLMTSLTRSSGQASSTSWRCPSSKRPGRAWRRPTRHSSDQSCKD